MNRSLQEACDCFGMQYLGNTEPINYDASFRGWKGFKKRVALRWNPTRYRQRLLAKKNWAIPDGVTGLTICVRPWVYDELFYYSSVAPKQLICTIDGVNPKDPRRSLRGDAWLGIDAPFRDLPTQEKIYAPDYLMEDASQLGQSCKIPASTQQDVYQAFLKTPLAMEFTSLVQQSLQSGNCMAVIFSQQLAASLYMTEADEIAYYRTVVDSLRSAGVDAIVFKQHPRDADGKMAKLNECFASMPDVVMVPNHLSCLPIEPFINVLGGVQLVAISTNSSVLLSTRAIPGAKIASFDSPAFTDGFRAMRDAFCDRHHIDIVSDIEQVLSR